MYTYTYMPRVTIHIRNEDWDKWTAIPSVPEWLHSHLNEEKPFRAQTLNEQVQTVRKIEDSEPHYENMEETA